MPLSSSPSDDLPAQAIPADSGRARPRSAVARWIIPAAIVILVAGSGFLGWIITSKRYEVLQVSMEPTLCEGDYVWVSGWGKLADSLLATLSAGDTPSTPRFGPLRGQIVVVRRQGFDELVLKRVVGLPGETIDIRDERIWINGQAIDEPYLEGGPTGRCTTYCSLTLATDQYYVMGDNRAHSNDSRVLGPVSYADIVGPVVMRFLPLGNMAFFP